MLNRGRWTFLIMIYMSEEERSVLTCVSIHVHKHTHTWGNFKKFMEIRIKMQFYSGVKLFLKPLRSCSILSIFYKLTITVLKDFKNLCRKIHLSFNNIFHKIFGECSYTYNTYIYRYVYLYIFYICMYNVYGLSVSCKSDR